MVDSNILAGANKAFQSLQSMFGSSNYPLVSVKSTIDGQTYRVRDMADKQEAADLLAKVRARMKKLYAHLQSKFPDKPQVKRLLQRFQVNPDRLLESTPDAAHTSYSVNKGEKVHFCLRQRQGADESLVNENVMVFVSLHEMAHMITDSIGHEPEKKQNRLVPINIRTLKHTLCDIAEQILLINHAMIQPKMEPMSASANSRWIKKYPKVDGGRYSYALFEKRVSP
jgi:hypothetical protein